MVNMRPQQCYWTRKLELDLISFVRQREFMWRQMGNTNYHIQQKYKAYAEFAATVGNGFTARTVRDRWVNIRSTFNHNLNRVKKSELKDDVYVPCWPLWKPLQFLRDSFKNKNGQEDVKTEGTEDLKDSQYIKTEMQSDNDIMNNTELLELRQQGQRTDRPRQKIKIESTSVDYKKNVKCKRLLGDLVKAMKPLSAKVDDDTVSSYWFFGKHVTERLNGMRKENAICALRDIQELLNG